ncbi:hypothetical protein LguiB_003722 [Lonicera macranthoides]
MVEGQGKSAVVLYPSPGIGHLVSTVELGKLILDHQPSFSVTILITTVPFNTGSTAPYISRVSAETPSINFHHLPLVTLPQDSSSFADINFGIPRRNNPDVRQVLESIAQKSKIRAFLIDFFCNAAFEVSTSLNIPTYYFYTSGASGLSNFLYFTTIDKTVDKSLKDLNDYIHPPGTPPIFGSNFPKPLLDRDSSSYNNFIATAAQMPKACGIIANTFETLEPRAVKAIADGLCVIDGATPPVYYVGPLISTTDTSGDEHECLNWLNSQPSTSVVFLCFGSIGSFDKEQLNDMAIGLEKSGQRFLWVVRTPPTEDQTKRFLTPPEPDLNAILPRGFLDRTKDRGLVVKSWAPQMAVLNHHSVGGFVTHCGWNSVLEAVCAGVPMLTWPLYAEQKMNKVYLVEELKLALPLDESEKGFVSAAELEKRVRELMESERGKAVRENVLAMRDASKAATAAGGCSRVASERLTTLWKQDKVNGS